MNVAHLFARDEAMLLGNVKSLPFGDGLRVVKYWLEQAQSAADEA